MLKTGSHESKPGLSKQKCFPQITNNARVVVVVAGGGETSVRVHRVFVRVGLLLGFQQTVGASGDLLSNCTMMMI